MLQDIRFAIRALRSARGFTAIAILALALGIGANSAIFTVVNSVLLQPLPFPDPQRICVLYTSHPGALLRYGMVAEPDFLAFREQNTSFESISSFGGGKTSLSGIGEPVPVKGVQVNAGFWPVLDVHAALGRTFLADEDNGAEHRVVVLSDQFWRSHFNADRAVIGKTVMLDGDPHNIVGVMPPGFAFPAATDLWTPMVPTPAGNVFIRRVIARLKPGVRLEQAGAEAQIIQQRLNAVSDHPIRGQTASVVSLQELMVGKIRSSLLMLLGAVGFIILIACANVANLLMARGAGRRQEVAVRASLGATRGRLVRQLLTESTLLAFGGGALGLLIASWTVPVLVSLVPAGMIPRLGEVAINLQVLAFTLLLSLLTSFLFGAAPAIQVSNARLSEFLKRGDSRSSGSQGLRSALVVAEVALSLVLLIGAGLMIKSFVRLRSVNPGFNPESVLALTSDLPMNQPRTARQLSAYHQEALQKLASLPGVVSAGAINWLPLDRALIMGDFYVEGKPRQATRFNVSKPGVTPDYFRAMGIRVLEGRAFDQRDTENAPPVAIVAQSVAKKVWGGESAIGKRLTLEDHPKPSDWLTVVGVVDDVKQQNLAEKAPLPAVYGPLAQVTRPFFLQHMAYVVRVNGNPSAIAGMLRSRFHEIDPNQPIQLIASMDDLIDATTAEPRFYSRLLGAFSAIALLLASLGIYGVMAYSVSQRTREIGIRVALGAQRRDIFRSVMGRSALLVSIGVALGLGGALGVTRVLKTLLFDVAPTDTATYAAVSLLLMLVALIASYLPAKRATTVDPMVALRYE